MRPRRSPRVAARAQCSSSSSCLLLDMLSNDELTCIFECFTTPTELFLVAGTCTTFCSISRQVSAADEALAAGLAASAPALRCRLLDQPRP